jgi:hypothetical protein
MLKRILMVIMVVCLLPAMSHAVSWSLTTRCTNAGGAIQVDAGALQTNINGNVIKVYPTEVPVTVTVIPNPGYAVSQVVYNGTTILNPTQTTFVVNGPTSQSVSATFAVQKFNISATVANGIGGTASPASVANLTYGSVFTAAKVFTFTPESTLYAVTGITGIPAGAIQSPAVPVAGQSVTVTFPVGFTVTSNVALVGTFESQNPVAKAGNNQASFVGSTVTLDGTGTLPGGAGVSGYMWTQTSGPATVTLVNAASALATFVPVVEGTYGFTLTVMPGGSTASTVVTVSANANQLVITQCQNCHIASNNPLTISAYTKWATSKHQVNSVVCANCHIGADTGLHPGVVPENKCISCHSSNQGVSPAIAVGHMGIVDTFKTTCYVCHKHDLVVTGAVLTCTSCHGNPPAAQVIHTTGFAKYTHGAAPCANCHNVPPTTDATLTHRDGAVEVLTNANACSVCHSYPPATPVHGTAVAGSAPNCANCHAFNFFTDATHNNGTVNFTNLACNTCHGHPPTVLSLALSGKTGPHPLSDNCAMCHGYVPADPAAAGLHRNGTVDTLKNGAPHFNNSTSAGYSASYVTSQVTSCSFCHNGNANNQAIRQQWATSGHANTEAAPAKVTDFKTLSPCARCHTTTGFIAYSTAKVITQWGLATDKTKEVITCAACHSDVANGVVRSVTPNQPFESDQTFTNADVGKSNVCMDCHGGRDSGSFIQSQVGTTDFTNYPFQYKTHYMTAGGVIQGANGFNFPGRTYPTFTDNSHSKIGMGFVGTGNSGPCVGCHMSAPDKHTFNVMSSANGTVVKINTTVCTNCHNSSLPASSLGSKRAAFDNALEVLRIALADKGYTWDPSVKTFYRGATIVAATNWGVGQAGANVLGAAYNYKLFFTEPNSYTHNPEYAKKLIVDSIDAVYNGGTVTGSIDFALTDLQTRGKITVAQVTSVTSYKQVDATCNSCHGNPPATATHNGIVAGTCATCHIFTGAGGATHNNGIVDFKSGGACNTCHGYPPATQTIHSTGFVKYTHVSSVCSDCHSVPATATVTGDHMNGTVDLLTNATACGSCHGAPPVSLVHTNAGASLSPFNCTQCHDYTGFNASTHNNGTVAFTNLTCNVCHGYPPMSQVQLNARVAGTFADARVEDYAGGGGHHSTHLLSTVTASEGFTPCLPCHPNSFHAQGGSTVTKNNVNIFDAADISFRFDESRFKRYDVVSQSCSNISCHFQPTPAW